MIILGNSNVDCLARSKIESERVPEVLLVKWVGALKIEHFYSDHPAAAKVEELFSREPGWKFLSVGTHDIYLICQYASIGQLEEALVHFLKLYIPIFSKFHALGKFAWLIFPQPSEETSFPNLSPQDILTIAGRFNSMLEQWCVSVGIPVINPTKEFLGLDGIPPTHLRQVDGIHLNTTGAKFYLDQIGALAETQIAAVSETVFFEPVNEVESFCSLLLNNLGLPWQAIKLHAEFQSNLLSCIGGILIERGIHIQISEDFDLIESGVLDSLDLVNIYTLAASEFPMEIPFDVDLFELSTVNKIYLFLSEKFTSNHPDAGRRSIGLLDFVHSLRANFGDSLRQEEWVRAESRIAKIDDHLLSELRESLVVACGVPQCPYGLPLLWIALCEAEKGNFSSALALLDESSSAARSFPLCDERIAYYRERWTGCDSGSDA
jgi:acyl carrier protein